jgi:signal transduction histidine kinase
MTVLFIFIAISFLALTSTQKAEQNRVWVGLSKETAHQLGTPISSLMAWVEYLKTKDMDIHLLDEMNKDVQRLKTIAERFSKIGSNPEPEQMNLKTVIRNAIEYMEKRISSKVSISLNMQEESFFVLLNESLFGWIIENLIKNAVDAMDGKGNIEIHAYKKGNKVFLDISDTGKGIPKSKFNSVFQPGYTTKKRGWGLGLSLVKRIIESSQKGKIYVYKSELNKGTTFRIELKLLSHS